MMTGVASVGPWVGLGVALAVIGLGAWLVSVLDRVTGALVSGGSLRGALLGPVRDAAVLLEQRGVVTERPDALLTVLAPATYAAVAAAALVVVPLGERLAIADVRTGIVLFGAAEALAIVAVFLHGWSANSALSLVGGYRFVAMALSYELVSMFVLIATALPAGSLQVSAIVEAQAGLWNVVRQPLGLPLWLVVMLGVSFWGPLDVCDSSDLAGGTSAESSGTARLAWEVARRGWLTVLAAMGAAVLLGGWMGPWLPGWAWMLLKTVALLALATYVAHRLGRARAERLVVVLWTVFLPLAFLDLVMAGLEALP